jgi:hypothetical protein
VWAAWMMISVVFKKLPSSTFCLFLLFFSSKNWL